MKLRLNVVTAIVSFFLSLLIVFFSYRLVIEYCGIDQLGFWSILVAWLSLFRAGDLGVGAALIKNISIFDVHRDNDQIMKFTDTALCIVCVIFSIISVVTYLLFAFFGDLIFENIAELKLATELVPYILLLNLFSTIVSTINGTVIGLHRGYVVQSLGILGSVLQLCLVFVFVPTYGLLGFACALIVQQLFLAVSGWVAVYSIGLRATIIPLNFSFEVAKKIITLGVQVQVVSVLNNMFEPAVKLLLSGTASRTEQGAFELAFKTVTLIRSGLVAGVTASQAAFANLVLTDLQAGRALYRGASKFVLVCSAGLMSVLLLCSWMISIAWLGYVDGAFLWFFAMCCVGYFFNMISAPAYNLGLAFGDLSGNFKGVALTLFLLIMLSAIFKNMISAHALVAVAALSLALGSIVTKALNEELLQNAN